jgi:type IV pilus assembly protein PilO
MEGLDFRNPTVQKIGGGVIIAIIIIIVWFMQMYSPNKRLIAERRNKLDGLRQKLNNAKMRANKLDAVIEERDSLYTKYKLLEKLMPTERDVSDFINKLYISATNNGIMVEKLDKKASFPQDFFMADPYELDITTSYHKLGFFLSEVANFPFTTTTSQMKLNATGDEENSLSIDLTLITYHIENGQRLKKPTDPRDKLEK